VIKLHAAHQLRYREAKPSRESLQRAQARFCLARLNARNERPLETDVNGEIHLRPILLAPHLAQSFSEANTYVFTCHATDCGRMLLFACVL